MYGRPYYRQSAGNYPQLVGYSPYPQLVGYAGLQRIGAFPQQLTNNAPPGAVAWQPSADPQLVHPLMGSNPGSSGTVLVDGAPTQTRQWPFPMPDTPIGAGPGTPGSSTSRVQLIIRPIRLTLTETTGPSVITDILVGQRSQMINQNGVLPLSMFSPFAVDSLVNFDTAQVGQDITLKFLNNGPGATIISAGLLCVTAT